MILDEFGRPIPKPTMLGPKLPPGGRPIAPTFFQTGGLGGKLMGGTGRGLMTLSGARLLANPIVLGTVGTGLGLGALSEFFAPSSITSMLPNQIFGQDITAFKDARTDAAIDARAEDMTVAEARNFFRNRMPGQQGFGVDLTMNDDEIIDFYNTTIDMEQKAAEEAAAAAKAAETGQFGLQDAYMAAQLLRMSGLLGNNNSQMRITPQVAQRGLLLDADDDDLYGMRRI
tara:strand:+ start:3703 stop:4389 length:687 start_codon:yes stop_codon:yes gene_type:complete